MKRRKTKAKPRRKRVREFRCWQCGELVNLSRTAVFREKAASSRTTYTVYCCPKCKEWNGAIPGLKAYAWRIFATSVKMFNADQDGHCACVTCGTRLPWNSPKLHAGHAFPGRHKAILFHRKIVHPQCERCNRWQGGQTALFAHYLIRQYGEGEYLRLLELARRGDNESWTREELCRVIKESEQLITSPTREHLEWVKKR